MQSLFGHESAQGRTPSRDCKRKAVADHVHIVLLTHPVFLPSESMARFAAMLKEHYEARGHTVAHWQPQASMHSRASPGSLAKWAGYIDLFLLFPIQMRRAVRREPEGTLFVFCDQALGPWVPLVGKRPHVVHCHDLLTLRAALNDIPVRRLSFTGRLYQRYIRRGFRQAGHFICISGKTREDLIRFGGIDDSRIDVVYNGLNYPYRRLERNEARRMMVEAGLPVEDESILLHVGSGAWYKNTAGMIRLYVEYAKRHARPLALWIVGHPSDSRDVQEAMALLPPQARVVHVPGLDNALLQAAYSCADALLFPSLAEGFGWPLVEAQCCGCPVVTTNAPPMNEIAGPEARYLPVMPADSTDRWAEESASVLDDLLTAEPAERKRTSEAAMLWARQFNADDAVDAYLAIYSNLLARQGFVDSATPAPNAAAPPAELRS